METKNSKYVGKVKKHLVQNGMSRAPDRGRNYAAENVSNAVEKKLKRNKKLRNE